LNKSTTCLALLATLVLANVAFTQDGQAEPEKRGWRKLTGETAPAVTAKEWLNTNESSPTAALQGKLWLLEFCATWCGPCMSKVGDLRRLHDRYHDVGLRIVAISDEPVALLRTKMVEGLGATYWIGSDPDNETHMRYSDGGMTGIPKFYLVGPDGKVIGEGLPSEARLRELLESEHLVTKDVHAKLARARTAYDAGAYGTAHKLAAALRQDQDPAVAADATLLCDKVASHAAFLQKLLAQHEGDANERYGELLRFTFRYDGLEPATWARRQLADLKKDNLVKRFLPEWTKLENAVRTEMQAVGNADKMRQAKRLYDEVAQKFGRSVVGQLAAVEAARLGGS
jgi:peroxiredoxin